MVDRRIQPILDDAYIEGIVELADPESGTDVERWLSRHGLVCLAMQAGFLITGSRAAFESAFGVPLIEPDLPLSLPIPHELQGQVASATIPPPWQMTAR